jgi:hypothetical protein
VKIPAGKVEDRPMGGFLMITRIAIQAISNSIYRNGEDNPLQRDITLLLEAIEYLVYWTITERFHGHSNDLRSATQASQVLDSVPSGFGDNPEVA